jgi:hypothetical protein
MPHFIAWDVGAMLFKDHAGTFSRRLVDARGEAVEQLFRQQLQCRESTKKTSGA